jgi:hypothetical protein
MIGFTCVRVAAGCSILSAQKRSAKLRTTCESDGECEGCRSMFAIAVACGAFGEFLPFADDVEVVSLDEGKHAIL